MANLALSNDANKVKISTQGGCEAVISALKKHVDNAAVAMQGCGAVAALACHVSSRFKLSSNGGCEAVLSALKIHMESAIVVEEAVKATANLAVDEANHAKLASLNGCELVIHAYERYRGNSSVANQFSRAVANMAKSDANIRSRFVTSNAKKYLQEILDNSSFSFFHSIAKEALSKLS